MGNIISSSDLLSHLNVINVEVLDYGNDWIPYLFYAVGKGKYNKKYFCLNCLDELIKK